MSRPAQAAARVAYFEYVSAQPDEEEGQQDRRRGGLLGSPRSGAPRGAQPGPRQARPSNADEREEVALEEAHPLGRGLPGPPRALGSPAQRAQRADDRRAQHLP